MKSLKTLPFAVMAPAIVIASGLGAQAPSVAIPRIDTSAAIDGVLDEPVWQHAARLDGFHQYQPVDSRPAEDSTVVLVWYSPTAIYFGIRAYDRRPDLVHATNADRDNVGSDDEVLIYLDTFNDRRRAYFFGSNPLGVQDDGVRSEGGFNVSFSSGSFDRNPDFIYSSVGHRTSFGYVIEMRIPFKSLRYAGGDNQTWGINVVRTTQRTGYQDTWTDVRRASESFLGQAGTITGIHGIHRGVVTEVQPELTARWQGASTPAGGFERDDITPSLGGNARLGFTNLTIDATVNPDFSQVESDAGLVTINQRFALFYPEQRPFFLEGIELFASPNNLVYTRTIADPDAGAKLTGKFGRWSVAHLTALDNEPTGPDALASFTRIRRDVGANSVAGFTFTDRQRQGAFNRVGSADARLLFGGVYYVQGQLAGSATRDSADGNTHTAPLWDLEFDRTGRAWGFNYHVTGIAPDFEAQSGFVPRTDVVNGRAFNRVTWYGAPGAAIEQFSLFGGFPQIWRYGEFLSHRPIEGDGELNTMVQFRGGWRTNIKVENSFVRFDPDNYGSYQVFNGGSAGPFVPAPGVFDAWNGSIGINTPSFQAYDASIQVAHGATAIFDEASRGIATDVTGSLNLRPNHITRVSAKLTYSQLRRASDHSEFARSIIPRVKVEVQPTRALFFRVVAEYRTQRRAALVDQATGLPLGRSAAAPSTAARGDTLRVDWLVSYRPNPGTEFFAGYGSSLDRQQPFAPGDLRRQQDAFFVKVAYLFRH